MNFKHLIATLLILELSPIAFAQIQYLPTENRNTTNYGSDYYSGYSSDYSGGYSGYYSEPTPQIIRTTAYLVSGENLYKIPIKVQKNGNYYKVIEQYVDQTGFGGRWQSVSGTVQKCTPAVAMNPLESQFMYKANVSMNWYYFDL